MLSYRPFTPADLEGCAASFLEVFSAPPWRDEWASRSHVETYLLEFVRCPSFRGWLAVDGGRVAGACFGRLRSWWQGTELYVDEMWVEQARQRSGVGTALLERVKADLAAEGVRTLILLTEANGPAEAFYRRNGFHRSERMAFMTCRTVEPGDALT